jgi:hypothetical protein
MAVAEQSPLQKGSYQPVTWAFKLIAQHALTDSAAWGNVDSDRATATHSARP